MKTNQIINADNVETLRGFPDDCIDLTVTSPPYDSLRTYGGHSWDFEALAAELLRVTKPGGVVVWVVNDATVDGSETGTSFRQALHFMDIGFRLHDTMIYAKNSVAFPDTKRYYAAFEFMFVLSKGEPKVVNLLSDRINKHSGERVSGTDRRADGRVNQKSCNGNIISATGVRLNIWTIEQGYMKTTSDAIAYDHPAIFPEALARDHILSWSNEGDLVLDPFSGSGTTAKMAKLMGRQYIGIEINAEYCAIAAERLRQGVLF